LVPSEGKRSRVGAARRCVEQHLLQAMLVQPRRQVSSTRPPCICDGPAFCPVDYAAPTPRIRPGNPPHTSSYPTGPGPRPLPQAAPGPGPQSLPTHLCPDHKAPTPPPQLARTGGVRPHPHVHQAVLFFFCVIFPR
jgi:hypothetical protein